jgi:hypothetical protein
MEEQMLLHAGRTDEAIDATAVDAQRAMEFWDRLLTAVLANKSPARVSWMLTVYVKNEADSIPGHVLKRIKEEIDASR